jgi:hypothetical protein
MFAPPTSPVFSDRPSGFQFVLSCACAMGGGDGERHGSRGDASEQARWSFAIEAERTGGDAVIAIPAKSQRHGAVGFRCASEPDRFGARTDLRG